MLLLAAVLLVVGGVHAPVLSARAVSIDDGPYLLDNRMVNDPGWSTAVRFLGEVAEPSSMAGYYQPLTMISLMLDVGMGGGPQNLEPFRVTSLILHLASTGFVVLLIYQLFGSAPAAAMVGLLFGLHPVAVDRVAWIADRKTVLSTALALASLVAYLRYARHRRARAYASALALFAMSLMAKPTALSLPLLLLLLDLWPLRRRWRQALLDKLPFVALSVLSIVVTAVSEGRTTVGAGAHQMGGSDLALTFCHNTIFYLSKVVWPVHLSLWYPFPDPLSTADPWIRAGLVGAPLLLLVLAVSLRYTPACAVGTGFFLIGFLPTLAGVLRVRDVIAANRFIYLPMVGIAILLAWLVTRAWSPVPPRRPRARWLVLAVVVAAAGAETVASRRVMARWSDSVTLHRDMVAKAPLAPKAYISLGGALQAAGDHREAITCYRRAIELGGRDATTFTNLGTALAVEGEMAEARTAFESAIAADPDYPAAHYNLGVALASGGDRPAAMACFRRTLSLDPGNADAHNNLGVELLMDQHVAEAVEHFRQAATHRPDHPDAARNLEIAEEIMRARSRSGS